MSRGAEKVSTAPTRRAVYKMRWRRLTHSDMHGCCGDVLGTSIRWLPHSRQHELRRTKCMKPTVCMVSGGPGHGASQLAQGDRSHRTRQTRRVFLPVSTGLSHMAGHGDDGAPVDHGYRLQRRQTTNHRPRAPSLRPLCCAFSSTCFPVRVFVQRDCLLLLVGFWAARVRVQQRRTRNVSQVGGAFHGRRGQRNSTFCRIRQLR
jgi:hypothetical protein